MPKLPTYTNIENAPGADVPQPYELRGSYDPNPIYKAAINQDEDFGKDAQGAFDNITKIQKNYATATIWQTHDQVLNDLRDDPDPSSIPGKYAQRMKDATDQIGGTIADPSARAIWQGEDLALVMRHGGEAAYSIARAREKEIGVNGLDTLMNNSRTSLANTDLSQPENQANQHIATDAIANSIDAASKQGWITPEQANAKKIGFVQGVEEDQIFKQINSNPDAAAASLSAKIGSDGTDPNTESALPKAKLTELLHAANAESSRQQRLKDQNYFDNVEKTNQDFENKIANNQLTAQDVLQSNLPAMGQGSKEYWRQQILKGQPGPTSGQSMFGSDFGQYAGGVYGGKPVDPATLTKAMQDGTITAAGASQLKAMSDLTKTPEGITELNAQAQALSAARQQIVKGAPGQDPVGEQNFANFTNNFYKTWTADRAKGITVDQMMDPKDPNYIGTISDPYTRSLTQALSDVTKRAVIPAPGKPADAAAEVLSAPPPIDQRKVDQVYNTPKGKVKWTGQGWLKVGD